MKNVLLILLVFCVAGAVNAQNIAPDPIVDQAVDSKEGPRMIFDKTTMDYGTVEQGSDPFRMFNFVNDGSEPLIIKHAKGSCGCTVPTYPREPIMPGEKAEIKVRYDTNRLGPFTKTIRLTTNIEGPAKILTIKGKVNKKAVAKSVPSKSSNMFQKDGTN